MKVHPVLFIAGATVAVICVVATGMVDGARKQAAEPSPDGLHPTLTASMAAAAPVIERPARSEPSPEAAPDPEDVRIYREAVADVEATAHTRNMTVAQLAQANGTTAKDLIAWQYALKKTRAEAVAKDQRVFGQ